MKDNEFIKQVSTFSAKILPEGASLWLFGSQARGDNREDSVWDRLVLLSHEGRATGKDYDEIDYPLN